MTTESKHTPGPWVVRKNWRGKIRIETFDVKRIANCPGGGNADPSVEALGHANARLIAAAPDLLWMLKDIRGFLKNNGYDVRLVDAAIAKAEGE